VTPHLRRSFGLPSVKVSRCDQSDTFSENKQKGSLPDSFAAAPTHRFRVTAVDESDAEGCYLGIGDCEQLDSRCPGPWLRV
jgi:hypothetical protein